VEVFSNSQLYRGIIGQDLEALNYLYSSFFPKVLSMIRGYGGQEADVDDIFQEAIIIFYRKAKAKELDENTIVQPYLMVTCKQIWFKFYREKSKLKWDELPLEESGEEMLFMEYVNNRKRALLYKHFKMLHAECKRVIKAFYGGLSYEEIAEKFGFSSSQYAKRKKYICKEILIKSIKGDPLYNKIFEMDESEFL